MPLDQIHEGMRGTAYTVFEGTKPEPMDVEVLGVLRNVNGARGDIILVRLHGTKPEYTGVVAGMSGSPVYVGGKLVGAISYRLGSFAKEPIAGITPIADMVKLARRIAADPARSSDRAPDLFGRFLREGDDHGKGAEGVASSRLPIPGSTGLPAAAGMTAGLQPIGTPLVCSGCDPRVLAYYAPIFEGFGLEPTSGGGAASGGEVRGDHLGMGKWRHLADGQWGSRRAESEIHALG